MAQAHEHLQDSTTNQRQVAVLGCAALCCAALRWAGLGWAGLGWAGLGWAVMIHNSSNQMLLQMQSNLSNSMVAQSTY